MKGSMTRLINKIVNILEHLTGLCAFIMMMSIAWQVFTRFVVKAPSIWTEEVARYSFMYMAMFGAAVGVRKSSHFGMTLFTDRLKGKARDIYMKYAVNLIIAACALFILFYGWDFAINYGTTRVSPTFLIPMTGVFISIPITGVFMLLFAVYNIVFEDYSHDISFEEELRNQDLDLGNDVQA
ncbi:TRAP transporter small permease [Cellulosilyticum sp. I15G10I2]|uniref:TRAP transporter small permease n=1 Tax=Cellulosilyticum sp. I15G10I2 TaxID=1892843 RepID=UPI00085C1EFC|nr:TRAP transporter small permease [Cellulosilyticum sp. I15G10I2]